MLIINKHFHEYIFLCEYMQIGNQPKLIKINNKHKKKTPRMIYAHLISQKAPSNVILQVVVIYNNFPVQ